MNTKRVASLCAISFATAMLAFALTGCSLPGIEQPTSGDQHGITVSASSDTKVVPDKARISVSVVTEDKTAEDCQNANADSVNAVIAALKKLSVEETSIQTGYSDLSPRYGSRTTDNDKKEVAYDEWVITGYEMTTELTISDLEISNVGAVIQACVAAGANETDGVEYYASNYDEVYNQALSKALETAKAKADGIASTAGVGLGKVTNVTEGYQDTSARYVTNAKEMYAMSEDAADGGSIAETMPGQLSIRAEVTVTYAIS